MIPERAERLRALWPWLPAFRVVAEQQHLTAAAERLGVTPAALSRTITKLEQAVDARLFDRLPRGMLLTNAGAELADTVREAMRRCDDVLARLSPDEKAPTSVRIAFESAPIGMLLDRCLGSLIDLGFRLELTARPARRMAEGLLSGEFDLGLVQSPSDDTRVVCKPVCSVAMRWATQTRLTLPPTRRVALLELPPSVGPPSEQHLRHSVVLVPQFVPVPKNTRTVRADTMTLWRLTRSRPSRGLLRVAELIGALSRK